MNLKSLTVRSCAFGNASSIQNVAALSNLEYLYLQSSGQQYFLSSIRSLQSLTLNGETSGNPILLPSDLGNLQNLAQLVLFDSIGPLPSSLYELPSLQSLSLYGVSGLTALSVNLTNLTQLESLIISNSIAFTGALPPLRNFPKLKFLSLALLGVTALPDLTGAPSLEQLFLTQLPLLVDIPPVGPEGTPALREISISGIPARFRIPIVNTTILETIALSDCGADSSLPPTAFTPRLKTIRMQFLPSYPLSPLSFLAAAPNIELMSINAVSINGTLPAPVGGFSKLNLLSIVTTNLSGLSPNFSDSAVQDMYAKTSKKSSACLTRPMQNIDKQRVSPISSRSGPTKDLAASFLFLFSAKFARGFPRSLCAASTENDDPHGGSPCGGISWIPWNLEISIGFTDSADRSLSGTATGAFVADVVFKFWFLLSAFLFWRMLAVLHHSLKLLTFGPLPACSLSLP